MSDFKAKMHQKLFRLGLCPRPRWGSLQHISAFKWSTSKERGWVRREGKGEKGGGGVKREGREGKGEEGARERDPVCMFKFSLE